MGKVIVIVVWLGLLEYLPVVVVEYVILILEKRTGKKLRKQGNHK